MRELSQLTSFAIVDVALPKVILEWAGGGKAEKHQLEDSIPPDQPTLVSEAGRQMELRGRTPPPGPRGYSSGDPLNLPPGTPHRQNIVLKVLSRLFPGTYLLLTLPLQVPWSEQLQVPIIGSWNPLTAAQEALCLWGVQEDLWAQKTHRALVAQLCPTLPPHEL